MIISLNDGDITCGGGMTIDIKLAKQVRPKQKQQFHITKWQVKQTINQESRCGTLRLLRKSFGSNNRIRPNKKTKFWDTNI